ncbi:unnamed protein product, partial [marine sediment metagenome]
MGHGSKVSKLVLDSHGSYLGMEKGCFIVRDKNGNVERYPLFEKEIGEVTSGLEEPRPPAIYGDTFNFDPASPLAFSLFGHTARMDIIVEAAASSKKASFFASQE